MQTVLEMNASTLLGFIGGLSGRVNVAFEEGTHSKWLYDLIAPRVAAVIVCDPRETRNKGNKTDKIDCHELANRLRGQLLKPVYQGERAQRAIKDLARSYRNLVEDCTRVMNRLKAVFRSRAIACAGRSIYELSERKEWLNKLKAERCALKRAEQLYRQLDFLVSECDKAREALVSQALKHSAYKLLVQVPGIGQIRAALILAYVMTPYRFRTKRQFWAYVGLAVVTRDSGEYGFVQGRMVRIKKKATTRGLNQNHNPILKEVFKGAAESAGRKKFKTWIEAAIASGVRPEHAQLNLARKLAAITLKIWKEGIPYDAKLSKQAT
jgi:transposase